LHQKFLYGAPLLLVADNTAKPTTFLRIPSFRGDASGLKHAVT